MGQRANPKSTRLYILNNTDSRWFASDEREYAHNIRQDYEITQMLRRRFRNAGISRVIIARSGHVNITMFVSLVGVIIGKKGAIIDGLKLELDKKYGIDSRINVKEVKKPDLDAQIVADSIASKMEERSGGFKIHIKRAIQAAMEQGALGIRVMCSGRLGGAEIARDEELSKGSVPLQTFKADISFGQSTARTTAGACGVKVWIFSGIVRKKYNPFEGLHDKFSRTATSEQDRADDYAEAAQN